MKAIVLTCDKYIQLTNHMIHKYQQLWPNNPFCFHVPYQNYPKFLQEKYGDKINLIPCKSDIISTINTLLSNLDNDEWIYWCIDDKYPISLNIQKIQLIYNWIYTLNNPEISGIIFCRTRNLKNKSLIPWKFENQHLIIENEKILIDNMGNKYFQRKDYSQIWIHQFLKVKVLRNLFRNFPNELSNAKEMDYFKYQIQLPHEHKLYVSKFNLAKFGESTTRGYLTLNCAKSLQRLGFKLPQDFKISKKRIIM